jgi:hypothetical protein
MAASQSLRRLPIDAGSPPLDLITVDGYSPPSLVEVFVDSLRRVGFPKNREFHSAAFGALAADAEVGLPGPRSARWRRRRYSPTMALASGSDPPGRCRSSGTADHNPPVARPLGRERVIGGSLGAIGDAGPGPIRGAVIFAGLIAARFGSTLTCRRRWSASPPSPRRRREDITVAAPSDAGDVGRRQQVSGRSISATAARARGRQGIAIRSAARRVQRSVAHRRRRPRRRPGSRSDRRGIDADLAMSCRLARRVGVAGADQRF